jgi:hypothetical protein
MGPVQESGVDDDDGKAGTNGVLLACIYTSPLSVLSSHFNDVS